ncbi:MAG: Hsp70 family protein, partial [Armatimonadota bacterium]|nr:Hsp70 family protein [Armatimonadota bacterium]
TLGRFILDGIPPAPRGVPKIEVTFDIDANGILAVSAKDLATGREQSIKITGTSTLTREEVERMIREAEAHAEEDRRKREEAEILNRGDSLAYQTERLLRDQAKVVSEADRRELEQKVAELRQAVQARDVARVRQLSDEVQRLTYRLSELLYRGAATGASTGGKETRGDGEVIDADYKPSD